MNAPRPWPLLGIAAYFVALSALGHEPRSQSVTPASAQSPAARGSAPQPVAPSAVPEETYGYVYPHHAAYDNFDREARWPDSHAGCIATKAGDDADAQTPQTAQTIDWCALPPQPPRYAPQVPASWWWRRDARWWRYGNAR
jgi:hypothetical protein